MKLLVTKSPMDIGAGGRYWHERATSQRGEKRKEGGRKEAAHDSTTRPLFSPPPPPHPKSVCLCVVRAYCLFLSCFIHFFRLSRRAPGARKRCPCLGTVQRKMGHDSVGPLLSACAHTQLGDGTGLGSGESAEGRQSQRAVPKKRPLIQW